MTIALPLLAQLLVPAMALLMIGACTAVDPAISRATARR